MTHSPNVIGKLYSSLASDYSESSTYELGSLVFYNGEMFKCTTAITTPEPWTAAHWTSTKVVDNFHKELTLEEVWQPAKVYHLDDIVQYNGKVYKCIVDNSTVGSFINESDIIEHNYTSIIPIEKSGAYFFGCSDGFNYVKSGKINIETTFTIDNKTDTVCYSGLLPYVKESLQQKLITSQSGNAIMFCYAVKQNIYSSTDFVFSTQGLSTGSIVTSTDTCDLKIIETITEKEWIEYKYRWRKDTDTFSKSNEVMPGCFVERDNKLYFVSSESTDTWHSTEEGWQEPYYTIDTAEVPITFDKTNEFEISGMDAKTFIPGDKTINELFVAWPDGVTTMELNLWDKVYTTYEIQRNEKLRSFASTRFKIKSSTGDSEDILGAKFVLGTATFVLLQDTPQEDASHNITVISNQPCIMVNPPYSQSDYLIDVFALYQKFTITKLKVEVYGAVDVSDITNNKMYITSIDGYHGGDIYLGSLGYIQSPGYAEPGQVLTVGSNEFDLKWATPVNNKPAYPEYNSASTYTTGARVFYEYKYYMAKQNVPAGWKPSSSTCWVEVVPENEAASQLTALATALGATFSITWDSTNNKFVYTYSI